MSHLYPLAQTALEALTEDRPAMRTRAEAERRAGAVEVEKLQTDWLSPDDLDAETLAGRAGAALGQGFVQTYEDEQGRPVYAVTYWKLAQPLDSAPPAPPPEPAKKPAKAKPAKPKGEGDHTDDLYFRGGRTRKRKRRVYVDPRQMDLFVTPDMSGYEHADPGNKSVIINDEEGDGTTFGG
ncbi:MAG: hypothetical protein MRY64_04710 [Hyphomonadaceae bacterium]|nr:hypothetical protein [Hyphomonadaceae bacterium]